MQYRQGKHGKVNYEKPFLFKEFYSKFSVSNRAFWFSIKQEYIFADSCLLNTANLFGFDIS